jgi:thiol-disulfide isomerase/thioredoxin
MSRSRREYTPLALTATGIVALVVVPVLVFQTGEDKSEPRGLAEPSPATVPAGDLATRPDDETAAMSLHDAPRELPDVRFTDGSGKPLSLAEFRGKVVLLNLWATWCGPCREEMPTLDRLQAALGGPDFEVVALSIDRAGMGVVEAFYAEIGVKNLARYIDESGKAAQQLNAVGLPTTLLLDREGREIARHVGPAEWDTPEMVTFFRQRLSQDSGALGPHDATYRAAIRTIRTVAPFLAPLAFRITNQQESSS